MPKSLKSVLKTDMASDTSYSGTRQMVLHLFSDEDGCAIDTVTTHTETDDYSLTTTTKTDQSRNETSPSMIIAADVPRSTSNLNNGGTVVFSIQFYGKTFGEVGILDQDLVQLDWTKFRSYLFQNVLSSDVQQEDIYVYYRDEEGDKLPIDSEEEYQEAVKVAKRKAAMNEKLLLDITRQGSSPTTSSPSTVLSLVSSGIRRVGSSPPKEGNGISFFRPMSSSSSSSSSTSLTPKDSQNRGSRSISERKFFPCFFVADNKGSSHGPWNGAMNGSSESLGLSGSFNNSTSSMTTSSTAVTTQAQNIPIHRSRSHHNYLHFRSRDSPPPVPFLYQASPSPKSSKDSKVPFPSLATHHHIQNQKDAKREEGKHGSEDLPPSWFITYMKKFHDELRAEIREDIVLAVQNLVQVRGHDNIQQEDAVSTPQQVETVPAPQPEECDLELSTGTKVKSREKFKKKEKPCWYRELSAKHKKTMNKEEKPKKPDRPEKRKTALKHSEDRDKCIRGQEKILAKMADLRRKPWCSAEQLNQLRKVVHKQHRLVTAEARQQRRSERKALRNSSSKMSKMSTEPLELETLAEDSSSETGRGPGYNAQFLHDITFPDGSTVEAGKTFVKTWRVRNNGLFPWNDRTMLCKWRRVRLPGTPAGWKLIPSTKKVPCPKLKPGEEDSISITFTAPDQPGWYATHWRFCQSGHVFGNQMWCAVCVVEKESDMQENKTEQSQKNEVECGSETATAVLDQPEDVTQPHVDSNCRKAGKLDGLFKSSGLTRDVFCPVQEGIITQSSKELDDAVVLVEDYFQNEALVQPAYEVTEGLRRLSICSEQNVADSFSTTIECKKKGEQEHEEPQMSVGSACGRSSFDEEAEMFTDKTGVEATNVLQEVSLELPHNEMEESDLCLDDAVVIPHNDRSRTMNPVSDPLSMDSSDSISLSSGTFSELDSEDQAILRESDSEDISDLEFCMVKMPECFNFKTDTTEALKTRPKLCEKSSGFCKVKLPFTLNNSSESQSTSQVVDNPSPALVSVSLDGDSGWSSCMASEKQPMIRGSGSTSGRVPYTTGALPDELVQDIPEDSVRGAWNTACTFISRINQEMLSPTESPKDTGELCMKLDPTENKPKEVGSEQGSAAKPVTMITEPHLYTETDPLQQLVSMGFTNLQVNQRLLHKYDGDVAKVIADLVVFNTL